MYLATYFFINNSVSIFLKKLEKYVLLFSFNAKSLNFIYWIVFFLCNFGYHGS